MPRHGGRACLGMAIMLAAAIFLMHGGDKQWVATTPSLSDATILASRRPMALPVEQGSHGGVVPTAQPSAFAPNGLVAAASVKTSEAKVQLVAEPLPQCSVVFFHHLEKTGGTTLRSIMQRHAQLGEFDFISFVNRFDKLQFQMVLHRLHTLLDQPDGLRNLRLAVEIHIGGHLNHPYFNMYTLPDLMMLRAALRSRGCRCTSRTCSAASTRRAASGRWSTPARPRRS